jgi:hypothetical protein
MAVTQLTANDVDVGSQVPLVDRSNRRSKEPPCCNGLRSRIRMGLARRATWASAVVSRRQDAGHMIAIEAAVRFLISAHLHPAVVHTCNKVTAHRCKSASMPIATLHQSLLSRPPRPRGALSALSPTQLRCPLCRLFRRQAASQPIAAGPDRRSVVHTGGDPAHARLQRRGWRNPGDLSARADQGNRGCHRHQKPVAKHFECATRPGADGRSRRPGAGSRRRW